MFANRVSPEEKKEVQSVKLSSLAYVGTKKTNVLVDCGVSAKRIENSLSELDLTVPEFDGILITHEHTDHIKGLGVIARRYGLPIFATGKTIDAIFDYKNLGNASHIWHDAADPVCYSFYSEEGAKASIVTDLGDYDEYLVEKIYDSDILFVEANHDVNMLQVGRYPYYLKRRILGREGHLSNERCAELIEEVATQKTKKVYLGHLSKENNYEKLAYETVKISLHNFTLPIEVARRDTVSTVTSVS